MNLADWVKENLAGKEDGNYTINISVFGGDLEVVTGEIIKNENKTK